MISVRTPEFAWRRRRINSLTTRINDLRRMRFDDTNGLMELLDQRSRHIRKLPNKERKGLLR